MTTSKTKVGNIASLKAGNVYKLFNGVITLGTECSNLNVDVLNTGDEFLVINQRSTHLSLSGDEYILSFNIVGTKRPFLGFITLRESSTNCFERVESENDQC